MRWAVATLAVAAAVSATPAAVRAHESRPLYIEVNEVASKRFELRWKVPPSVPSRNSPTIAMPPGCEPEAGSAPGRTRAGLQQRSYRCTEDLSGRRLELRYPYFNPSVSTLTRVSWLSGDTYSVSTPPSETRITLPSRESPGGVAIEYLALGIRHILSGYDHLLFLVCLVLIAGTGRRIFWTVTGFTLAHSLTLVLSTLGLVRLPVAPVEAVIALSIVFVATEIARGRKGSLTYRHPIVVSSAFGLLHGFGFASVLSDTGLPQTEIPVALLFFNLGVEVGQLAFIVVAIVLYYLVQAIAGAVGVPGTHTRERLGLAAKPAVYLVGSLAAFWMFQRIAGFWTT